MKPFTLQEIAAACGGTYVGSEAMKTACITSVERDSRQVAEGSLFLAIKGGRVDGHDFIETCYRQGAVCALCEKAPENARSSTSRSWACPAAWARPRPRKCSAPSSLKNTGRTRLREI